MTDAPRDDSPWIALLIIAVAVASVIGIWTGQVYLDATLGEESLHHVFSWSGAFFLAVFTAAFYALKRRKLRDRKGLLRLHTYGGLLAFSAISVHFAWHMTRLELVDPGTGVVLYAGLLLSVATGMLMRYGMLKGAMRHWRMLHSGAAVSFYLAIVVHVAVRLGLI